MSEVPSNGPNDTPEEFTDYETLLHGGGEPAGSFHIESTDPGNTAAESEINPNYNRDFDAYLDALNGMLKVEDLSGKTVLDIGSGAEERFSKEARRWGAEVYSLNPALVQEQHRQYLHDANRLQRESELNEKYPGRISRFIHRNQELERPNRSVAGLGQELPYADESFDIVVSVFAVPHYLHSIDTSESDPHAAVAGYTPEQRDRDKAVIKAAFEEMLRVLRPGGKAYIADGYRADAPPTVINKFSPTDGSEVREALDELEDKLNYRIDEHPVRDKTVWRSIEITKK